MNLHKLAWHDLQWCLRRAPRKVLEAMKKHGAKVMVAGGYIRSCITNEHINDIDLFVDNKDFGRTLALELAEGDEKRIHETDNAFTVKGYRYPVQIIHRWLFTSPEACILSFDFTIARAAFWCVNEIIGEHVDPAKPDELPQPTSISTWASACDARFYPDLAGKRLIYCSPVRIEEAGGSMLRVLKFYQRGYRIPLDSLGKVISRLCMAVKWEDIHERGDGVPPEQQAAKILSGLLREVDPNIDPSHIAHLPSEPEDGADPLQTPNA